MEERKSNGEIPLVVIAGPTATGKTDLSILLAERIGGEIVSADSVQIYRYLDIGSAKPTTEERRNIPHYMIDVVTPDADFTVFDYQTMARKHIFDIHSRNKLPILVGGTGLYIKALIDDYTFRSGKYNAGIRKKLQKELNDYGKEYLYQKLQEIDPSGARKLHINDTRRIVRALEYYYLTGEPISRQQELTLQKKSPYKLIMVGLFMERELLYSRINRRVALMLQKGLLSEVKELVRRGYSSSLKSLQSLGYKHMLMYLQGNWEWEKAVSLFKQDTRKFAKRQMTWFRADKRITWMEIKPDLKIEPILDSICKTVAGY